MEYVLTPFEFDLLRYPAENIRGTWVDSFRLSQDFSGVPQDIEPTLRFLKDKKLIEIEIIEQGYFFPSSFKVRITEPGYSRYIKEKENYPIATL